MRKFITLSILSFGILTQDVLAKDLCLEGVCIGDSVDELQVEWEDVELNYDDRRFIETELADRDIKELYYDYNEQIIASKELLEALAPYVIRKQRFDSNVLKTLGKVRAICSSLTLTGEVKTEGDDKLFVTFRAVADAGQRGLLRVVRVEKQYNIMSPHLRPADAAKYRQVKKQLKERYPTLAVVRDIDSRMSSDVMRNSNALLGFRFFSTVTNPLILRIIDPENVAMIEDDDNASAHCSR